MALHYLTSFKHIQTLHDDQKMRLGQTLYDENGDRWSYVQFDEACGAGEHVRDSLLADLITAANVDSGVGGASKASAIGNNLLHDTGAFTKDIAGAIGFISAGTGIGQVFTITKMIDDSDDAVEIALLSSATGVPGKQGWAVALSATSKYRLIFPGRVKQGDGSADITRGVTPIAVTIPSGTKKYGYVRQSGLGYGKIDASADDIAVGENVLAIGAGLFEGFAATETALEVDRKLGKAILGDIGGSTDTFAPIDFNINNTVRSHRQALTDHPFNEVVIR